jgi:flagellum-specific peptidoglycan hydrolase FlgJ
MKAGQVFLVICTTLFGTSLHWATANALEPVWECYLAKPGHPTDQDKRNFLELLKPVASELQAEYGIPRAGILSMAINESGYGWTRTAVYAHNVLGWKYGRSARKAKLSSWRLDCQPVSDPGNEYVQFDDFEHSMRFVGNKLAKFKLYSDVTRRAKQALAANQLSEHDITKNWLQGIQQAGYNPNPAYAEDVMSAGTSAGIFKNW